MKKKIMGKDFQTRKMKRNITIYKIKTKIRNNNKIQLIKLKLI